MSYKIVIIESIECETKGVFDKTLKTVLKDKPHLRARLNKLGHVEVFSKPVAVTTRAGVDRMVEYTKQVFIKGPILNWSLFK